MIYRRIANPALIPPEINIILGLLVMFLALITLFAKNEPMSTLTNIMMTLITLPSRTFTFPRRYLIPN